MFLHLSETNFAEPQAFRQTFGKHNFALNIETSTISPEHPVTGSSTNLSVGGTWLKDASQDHICTTSHWLGYDFFTSCHHLP